MVKVGVKNSSGTLLAVGQLRLVRFVFVFLSGFVEHIVLEINPSV